MEEFDFALDFVEKLFDHQQASIELMDEAIGFYQKITRKLQEENRKLEGENRALRVRMGLPVKGYSYRRHRRPWEDEPEKADGLKRVINEVNGRVDNSL